MKKIIIPIGMLLIAHSAYGQLTQEENYVQTKTYLDYNASGQATKVSETVQYFDGLGRPKQTVNVKASPLGRDVVSSVIYDPFGRQTWDYLPVPQNGTQNGGIYTQTSGFSGYPVGDPTGVYAGEKIHSEKILESSPLNRVQEQYQVGNDWTGKPVKFEYDANLHEDYVRMYEPTTTWVEGRTETAIALNQYFFPSQLYKNTITDEDGNKTIEFKNTKGQLILSRKVLNASENADTYYVYNEYGQLAFVIPPLASAPTIVDSTKEKLYYQYRYDGRGRLVEKKLPGKGWEYMVYDIQDRPVAIQDANLRAKGQWIYTKYDQFGRVAYTGTNIGGNRLDEQSLATGFGINNVKRSRVVFWNYSGMDIYYDHTGTYPNFNFLNILSINYYDNYPFYGFRPPFPSNIQGEPVLTDSSSPEGKSTKGLPVMTLIKNIEDDRWTKNYTYYDMKGRVIGTHSINHLGGYTRTESRLDFVGLPLNTVTTHRRYDSDDGITIAERFVYDSQNRLLQHWHKVDSKPEQLLAENTYNELSQLKNKKVGNNLQSIDYAYNIRGWMTDINKDQMGVADLGGKLFSYKIKYNQKTGITNPDSALFPGKDVKPKYNGNIAEVDWRAVESLGANPSLTPKRYGYAYDSLNRLTAGYYQNPQNPNSKEHTESLSYDLNGNITNLYRTSVMNGTTAMVIDNLVYNYGTPGNIGNRLLDVRDNSTNKAGYEGGGKPINYDVNGNMTDMLDKNISRIGYNYLNLPNDILIEKSDIETTTVKTKYTATGVKLKKEFTSSIVGIAGVSTTKKTTDYLDGFQYLKSEATSPGGGGSTESLSETSVAMERQAFTLQGPVNPTDPDIDPPFGSGDGGNVEYKMPDLQFFPTAEGFYDYKKNQYIYQYKDHLGNVRISFGRTSAGALEITDANDYYPFGMNHLKTGNAFFGQGNYKNYKYNGKELQETGMYDYGARLYMSDLGRWGVVDPLAEKYRRWSPYNYAMNNPIRFIDPDGRGVADIRINGTESDNALKELQKSVGSDITLSRDTKSGNITYVQNTKGSLSGNSADVAKIINDHSVVVNVSAENKLTTSSGLTHNGGAFLGNSLDASTKIVTGEQAINPEILGRLGDFAGKPGEGVLHEISESYEGALISRKENNYVGAATQSDALDSNSVYYRAHNAAVKQPGGNMELQYMTNDGLILKNPTGLTTGTNGTDVKKIMFNSSGRTIFTKYPDGTFTTY
ncbi:hypothetical protein BBI01_09180 [Chryseobacterium artocarpi]|uniref:DUF6443 domain-containing protein n=1 Tax=Chryseobacterium artocarpi TaxID=1414727 RepID=A0A1B8ZL20_9FLAO|nr:DUF6443 domain-containing protein [Chryseobacterium artocarpi]OCA72299.1 hypothetical protein BBI01_09180 [Chryseobacterium artocarpi]